MQVNEVLLAPDYSFCVKTLKEVSEQFNADIKIGWNETPTDTALVFQKENQYCVQIWNRPNIRAELIYMLSLPIHRLETSNE